MTRTILTLLALAVLSPVPGQAADQRPKPVICSELTGEGLPSICLEALEQQRAESGETQERR